MSRPKKDGIYLNIKLDKNLYCRLERVSGEACQTKTLIVERALAGYLDEFEEKQKTLRRLEEGTAVVVELSKKK